MLHHLLVPLFWFNNQRRRGGRTKRIRVRNRCWAGVVWRTTTSFPVLRSCQVTTGHSKRKLNKEARPRATGIVCRHLTPHSCTLFRVSARVTITKQYKNEWMDRERERRGSCALVDEYFRRIYGRRRGHARDAAVTIWRKGPEIKRSTSGQQYKSSRGYLLVLPYHDRVSTIWYRS